MQEFHYDALPGRVVFGAGVARRELRAEADRLGVDRVLLVATESEEPLARELAAPLGERVVAVFTSVRPHVPIQVAEAARALAISVRADAVLSVGGGSTTGTAKAIALTTGLPIIAVPTTYAGSEVTPVWGLTESSASGTSIGTEGSRKTTGVDHRVLPRTVVYDPELTMTLPADLSAASGLNALAHCVEAFWAPRRNPISSLAAEEGIRALAAGLPSVHATPGDLAARSDLLYGAYLAGSAFAVAGSGLHHKICHALGGAYNLPHAQTHAIVLPEVLAFNAPAAPDAARRIGRALRGGSDGDPVGALRALSARLGIPRGLRELGLEEDQIDVVAALVEPAVPADNPRRADRAALREIIHAAWAGAPLA
ncbi:MAG: maleylacetate reductase, partial [Pseudonocardiales bacterium]|nr:maleylacetate reductase [Pseudonocardiales bacterium]